MICSNLCGGKRKNMYKSNRTLKVNKGEAKIFKKNLKSKNNNFEVLNYVKLSEL